MKPNKHIKILHNSVGQQQTEKFKKIQQRGNRKNCFYILGKLFQIQRKTVADLVEFEKIKLKLLCCTINKKGSKNKERACQFF